ncbi:MAG: tetratricopeptide repeat protein [Lachnospiraceae bacterium]|nr:tetratricopeptide repeat protein [Lachnospiraceae bacterium]
MKKKRIAINAMLLFAGLIVSGCGKKVTVNIDDGMSYIEALDYQNALLSFEKAVESGEDPESAYRGAGIAHMGMTNYEEAIDSFEKALQSSDMFVDDVEYDISYYLATAKYKNNDPAGAVAVLDHIIALRPRDEQALFLRGSIKALGDSYEQGLDDLEQAMLLSGKNVERVIGVFKVLKAAGHETEGREYLNNVLGDTSLHMTDYESGRIYYYMEDYENARNSLEQARISNKEKKYDEADIILMLGQTYEQLGDKNYAAGLYEDFISENGEQEEICNQLGLCKLDTGDYEAALSAFQSALSVGKGNLQSLKFNEIVAYEHLGQFTKAKLLMESYLKEYPDDAEAKREYEFLKTR